MSLFYRIMCQMPEDLTSTSDEYYEGFAEGSQKAAKLAKEADKLMAEMADILWSASIGCAVNNKAADAVEKYNAWKERTQ